MRDAALAALSAVLEDDNASPAARVRAAEMVLRPSGALEPAPPPFTPPPAAPIPTTKLEEAESRYRELTRIVDTLTGNPAALVAAIEHRARAYADVLAARAEEGQAVPAERELSTLLDELGTAPTAVQEAVLQHLAGILRVELRPL